MNKPLPPKKNPELENIDIPCPDNCVIKKYFLINTAFQIFKMTISILKKPNNK